jgi:hypothetical protein
MKRTHTTYLFLVLAIAAISAGGCTVIGFGVGCVKDYVNAHSHDTTAAFTQPLFRDINDNVGRLALIQYNDSEYGFATFDGYTDEPDSDYRARWTAFFNVNPNTDMVPFKIGDNVTLHEGEYVYQAQQFEFFNLPGRFEGYTPEGIDVRFSDTGACRHFLISRLTYAGKTGWWDSLGAVRSALDSNAVPVRCLLHFTEKQKQFTLTNTEFYYAKFIGSTNNKWEDMKKGAEIDLTIILFIPKLIISTL